MDFGRTTCERCGLPGGESGFCANCRVLNADPGGGLYAASGAARLTARLIDLLLFPLCLGVGWWLWLGATAGEGQSPAKRMLGLRVVRADGSAMGGGAVWFREGVAALLLTPLLPLSALWALRSPGRQALHDLLAGSVVVDAEARPAAGYERRRARAVQRETVLPPASVRRPEPPRSRAPERSGSTGGGDARPAGPVSRPVSRAPERSSKPDHPHEQLPDDRPMWPGGVPPWERHGPGAPTGGVPPAPRTPPPQRPAQPPPRWGEPPPSPSGGRTGGPIEYSPRATTAMEKIAELEQMYRRGGMSRTEFENERRRLIAES